MTRSHPPQCPMQLKTFLLDHTGLDGQMTDYLSLLAHVTGPVEIRLDMRRIEWLCSATLGSLILLHRRVLDEASRLVLENVNGTVADVLQLTRLDQMLDEQSVTFEEFRAPTASR
jgi:anti-anti-sigma factor